MKDKITLSLGVAVGSSIVSALTSIISTETDCPFRVANRALCYPVSAIHAGVGGRILIGLLSFRFIVTLGWWIDKPLTLLFDPFESIVLFLTGT